VRKNRQSGRILPVVILLVLLAGGGFAAWYFLIYVKSPQYALNHFLAAAKADDVENVVKWTDAGGQLMMLFNMVGADPVALLYPGYNKSQDLGRVEKVEVGTITQKDDTTAEAQMSMEVIDAQGNKETRKPVYVLRKSDEGWKVAVEPTIGGSFNEIVSSAFKARVKREAGRFLSQPMGEMARAQIRSLQSTIDQYPQLKAFLKEIGL
jgi:hypothetical protein